MIADSNYLPVLTGMGIGCKGLPKMVAINSSKKLFNCLILFAGLMNGMLFYIDSKPVPK